MVDKDSKGMVCTRTRLGTRPLHVMCKVLVLKYGGIHSTSSMMVGVRAQIALKSLEEHL